MHDIAPAISGYIKFQDVCLEIRGTQIIRNISCKISLSGTTVIMGPNGAGKSLFLRLLAGLLEPSNGKISSQYRLQNSGEKPAIAILFQQPVLLRRSTRENIEYVLRLYPGSKHDLTNSVNNALKEARLEDRANTPARRLSGGERQRLALARALAINPKILLLDEVTASLDPASSQIVENMTLQAAKYGTKIIFITHDVRQAKRIADDIVFIHRGQLLVHKQADKFFKEPGAHQAQAYLDGRVPLDS